MSPTPVPKPWLETLKEMCGEIDCALASEDLTDVDFFTDVIMTLAHRLERHRDAMRDALKIKDLV
jgi:hypothetical protein